MARHRTGRSFSQRKCSLCCTLHAPMPFEAFKQRQRTMLRNMFTFRPTKSLRLFIACEDVTFVYFNIFVVVLFVNFSLSFAGSFGYRATIRKTGLCLLFRRLLSVLECHALHFGQSHVVGCACAEFGECIFIC